MTDAPRKQKKKAAPDPRPRELYTVQEFCRRNSVCRAWFYVMLKRGEIRAVKMGKRTLVPADAEAAWHRSLRPTPQISPHGEHGL